MLIDSNILIYAAEPQYDYVRKFIDNKNSMISIISKVEVLGYYKLSQENRQKLNEFFNLFSILPISNLIIERAINLRQQRKMSLGDVLIAATALEHGLQLATANTKDFLWINGLRVINPINIK